MHPLDNYAESIAEAARTIREPRGLDDTLQTIVEVARHSVPGFDHVGIATMHKTGKVETRAFIGDLVVPLDAVQYELREGPCSAALQGTDEIALSSLRTEQRWPGYVPRARAEGVRSQMAVRLELGNGLVGGINFYSTLSDEVSQDARALGRLFATHAATALGHAHERETLNEALQTRKVIGQALGILMERYAISEERAFAFLVRASSHGNIKLRTVAQELVDRANRGTAENRPPAAVAPVRSRHEPAGVKVRLARAGGRADLSLDGTSEHAVGPSALDAIAGGSFGSQVTHHG